MRFGCVVFVRRLLLTTGEPENTEKNEKRCGNSTCELRYSAGSQCIDVIENLVLNCSQAIVIEDWTTGWPPVQMRLHVIDN